MARLHSCNVLQAEGDLRHLWQFSAGHKFNLLRDEARLPNEPPLPAKLIAKDWQTLFQPRLNVAWLPAEKVFLRALQLPKADFAETQSMVELQLEKLSPLPVAQVVWTFELLPHSAGDMQTAIVIIVARHFVEEFLGQLEGQGYLADRLELPIVDQLQATDVQEDGVWIYPGVGGPFSCLVAWWYDRVLQNVSLLNLPPNEQRGTLLQNQLTQMIWAGELEGWLHSPPRFHLVAEGERVEAWKAFFPAEQMVEVVPSAPQHELAAMTARRATSNEPRVSMLPPEFTTRYRQQFVDRLWMRSLGAAVIVYLAGLLIYFGLVQFANWQLGRVQDQVVALGPTYTNALQLKERVKVLQDQMELQFAALDCYKAIADYLPTEVMLDSLNFEKGRKLTLTGSASSDDVSKVYDFNGALMKAMDRTQKQRLFTKVSPPNISPRPGANQSGWTFSCDLKRTDTE